MAGTGESCSLCESLRDPESAAGHEATLAQLEATAPICPLCAILLEVVRHYELDEAARKLGVLKWREVPLSAMDRLWETNIPLLGWVQDPRGTRITRSIYAFRVRGMSLFFSLSLSLILSHIHIHARNAHRIQSPYIDIVASFFNPEWPGHLNDEGWKCKALPFLLSGVVLPYDTSSDESFSWLKTKIRACDRDHDCFDQDKPRFLPTRVLDIGRPSLKLHESKSEEGRYVCLSHCWGKPRPRVQTTKETLPEYLVKIPDDLPKTFRDAVKIAQAFGVRYLWIDTLYIIQGDNEDLEQELSRMEEIYENAYFTIAATASLSSEGGCFKNVPLDEQDLRFQYSPQSGELFTIRFRQAIDHLQDI
jgi:hypothetical protein